MFVQCKIELGNKTDFEMKDSLEPFKEGKTPESKRRTYYPERDSKKVEKIRV